MRKIVIYFLVLHFATGGHFCKEILYLPKMLSHYQEHNKNNPQIALLEFIRLHYFDGNHRNADQKHHSFPLRAHFKAPTDKALVQSFPLVELFCCYKSAEQMPQQQFSTLCLLAGHALDLLKPPIMA